MSWNDEGPWGRKPNNDNKDFEKVLKQAQEGIKKLFPSGGNSNPKKYLGLASLGLAILWLSTGVYTVSFDEKAVVLRFGEAVRVAQPGLNYHLPLPFERVITRNVTTVHRIDSGDDETLMLTGDENLVDINFTVLWVVKDLEQYLFNAVNPDDTIKAAAESAVREIIAHTPIASALTEGRSSINQKAQALLQSMVDSYKLGVMIQEVQLQRVDPPPSVIDSYRDVQRAKADQERLQNEAEAHANSIIPVARGEAQKIIQEAEAYKQEVVALAEGHTKRFLSVLSQYSLAPDVTSSRLYFETMEGILGQATKVVMEGNQGPLPYLPLPALSPTAPTVKTEGEKQ